MSTAEDHALAAVIAQVPHVSGPAAVRSVPFRVSARLVVAGLRVGTGRLLVVDGSEWAVRVETIEGTAPATPAAARTTGGTT